MMANSLSKMAKNYPYLTIETTDGKKTSFSTASMPFFAQDGKLMAGTIELVGVELILFGPDVPHHLAGITFDHG